MEPQISYRWTHIEDYEGEAQDLAVAELRTLAGIWVEQRSVLEENEGLEAFLERLRREWAIETGLLERVYTLDRGVTQLLIERGIDAALIPNDHGHQDPGRVAAIIRDHEAVAEGLFAFVRGDRALSTSYINELHAQLLRNQETVTAIDPFGRAQEIPLRRGQYKERSNNPTRPDGSIHQYCPPEHVSSEMDRLVELHAGHEGVPPEVESAWLHHRFTQIHPYQDGNGRVARALASIVFIRAGWFPLVIRDTTVERSRYLDALEQADHGDLKPLVELFAASQKRAFIQALGISGQVLRLTRAEQVVAATREQFERRERERRAEWEKAKETASALQGLANERMQEITDSLAKATAGHIPHAAFYVDSEPADGERDYYFRWQIIETAKQLDYFANTREHHAWTRLVLRTGPQAEILVSFHGTGHEYRGILAVSACFFRREATDEGEREIEDITPLTTEIFQVNYQEGQAQAEERFREWLELVLVKGLEIWRKGL